MSHTLFLKIALPAIAIPALIVLFLPAGAMSTYADMVEPLSLIVSSFLALYVSFSYSKELKTAFIFLSVFLLIYALAFVLFSPAYPILVGYLEPYLGVTETLQLIQGVQFINYAMLLFFCINLLKVVDIRQLNRRGWLLFALTVIYAIIAALYPVLDSIRDITNAGLPVISYITIRILDAALIIVLVPVLWLYIQYLALHQRQSLTFTVIIFGIVCSTIFDYLFQLIIAIFPRLLAEGSPLETAIPELLFIYGYLMIAVGLYAHRKQDEWGYKAVDRAMSGELKLVDIE